MKKDLQQLLRQIFDTAELRNNPPVLIDIGASGSIHERWKAIAPFSICIAFDADSREFGYIEKENSGYKKLIVFNSLVSDQKNQTSDFYLTESPHCSSSLEPDTKSLQSYEFSKLFDVKEKIKLNSVYLPDVLKELNITKIDWYKSDSQGTDLRLFKSLDIELANKVIVAEFEPGIIDAYKNEDKLFSLMSYMNELPFWMCEMDVKKVYRIRQQLLSSFSEFEHTKIHRALKTSPGWAEVIYFNTFENKKKTEVRDLLLAWVCATLLKQHGFALEITDALKNKSVDKLASQLQAYSRESLTRPVHDFRKRVIGKIGRFIKKLE